MSDVIHGSLTSSNRLTTENDRRDFNINYKYQLCESLPNTLSIIILDFSACCGVHGVNLAKDERWHVMQQIKSRIKSQIIFYERGNYD